MTNYLGKKINMLTVIQDLENGSLLCRCDCGNVKRITRSKVITGHVKSCGCLRKKKEDLTGKTIGNFTILKELFEKKVQARCNLCGSVKVYMKSVIKNQINKSCGCLSNPDLTGKTFGRLTVIRKLETESRETEWLCKCECGNFTKVTTYYLKSGRIRSCGCLIADKAKETYAKHLGKMIKENTSVALINKEEAWASNANSGIKGVYKNKRGKWYALLTFKGKRIYLGSYDTIEEATQARKEGEKEYFKPAIEEFKMENPKRKRKNLDIVGKKFNMLTVLKELDNGKILCRCDCGTVKEINKNNVIQGTTKSCGCQRRKAHKDYTGQKFNMLTIIEELGGGKVRCRCDCGTVKEMNKYNVVSGQIFSCGCIKREAVRAGRIKEKFKAYTRIDITGKKFNKLTVIRELGYGQVLCQCDCGNVKEISKSAVIHGRVKSCGCLKKGRKQKEQE